mmetsp:Transcript_26063/g.71774  ORF Transcript_26063/g.71774 Transcript_26063/m.71774 type:complete len:134 (-) Transcript_26063:252-653(-)
MMIKTFFLTFLALFASTTSAFVQRGVSSKLGVNTFAPSTDTSLNMALENQSPQLRKNVMAATVSAFAMPTIAGTLSTTLATTAIPATLATSAGAATYLSPDLAKNPAVLGGLFLAHWFATNIVLQKFKDVKEL